MRIIEAILFLSFFYTELNAIDIDALNREVNKINNTKLKCGSKLGGVINSILYEDKIAKAQEYNCKGYELDDEGKTKEAIAEYEKGLKIIGEDSCFKVTATLYHNLASSKHDLDKYDESIIYLTKAIKLKKAIYKSSCELGNSYNSLGLSYSALAQYKKAIKYIKKAIEIDIDCNETDRLSDAYTNIAEAYRLNEDYNKSLIYNDKALDIENSKKERDIDSLSVIYNNIGLTYDDEDKPKLAIENYLISLKYKENLNKDNTISIAKTYNNIAASYDSLCDYNKSLEYYNRAIQIYKNATPNGSLSLYLSYNNIGFTYENMNQTKKAYEYYKKAYFKVKEILGDLHPTTKTLRDNYFRVKDILDKESSKMSNKKDEKLVPVFIPALFEILLSAEKTKGSPLTKEEVDSIRDISQTIMMPKSMVKQMNKDRGYSDIDPKNCWNEWQLLRKKLIKDKKLDNHDALTLESPHNNPKMRSAEDKAKNTLNKFREYIKKHPKTPALIKYRVQDEDSSTRMWLFVDKDLKDGFKAQLFEVPSDFKKYKAGDSFIVKDSDILDWMINDNGDIYGAYTIRAQREGMNKQGQEEMDRYMGAKRYLDL